MYSSLIEFLWLCGSFRFKSGPSHVQMLLKISYCRLNSGKKEHMCSGYIELWCLFERFRFEPGLRHVLIPFQSFHVN